jgi:hypothetical protein
MISPIKRVLFEYHTFFTKMALNAPTIVFTKSNMCLLTNVKTLLGLNVIMPLLEAIHSLIKLSQLCDVFVCVFIIILKICEGDVYQMYYDNQYNFQGDVFGNFHALINYVHESIDLRWIKNLTARTNHLTFKLIRQHVWTTYVD